MHGFSQGKPVLESICADVNNNANVAILIQEHWLTPVNMPKLCNFSTGFSGFGISAMDDILSKGILRGRPFGGVYTLINSSLLKSVTYYQCAENLLLWWSVILFLSILTCHL